MSPELAMRGGTTATQLRQPRWRAALLGLLLLVLGSSAMGPVSSAQALKFAETRHPLAAGNGQLTPTTTPTGVVTSYVLASPVSPTVPTLFALDRLNRVANVLAPPAFTPATAFATGTSPARIAVGALGNFTDLIAVANTGDNSITLRHTGNGQGQETRVVTGYGIRAPLRVAIGFGTIFVLNSPDADGWKVIRLQTSASSITGEFTSSSTTLDPAEYDNDPQDPYPIATGTGTQNPALVIANGRTIQYFSHAGPGAPLNPAGVLDNPAGKLTDKPIEIVAARAGSFQRGDVYTITKGPDNPGSFVNWEVGNPFSHPAPGATHLSVTEFDDDLSLDALVSTSDDSGPVTTESVRLYIGQTAGFIRGQGDDFPNPPTVTPIAPNPYTAFGTPSRPVSVTSGDYDGDGRAEIATANSEAGDISVLHQIGAATQGTLTVSPTTLTANGLSTATVTFSLRDADDRGVFGDRVSITADGPADITGGPTVGPVTDQGDGTYTATVTSSRRAGAVTITATDASVSPNLVRTAQLDQVADLPASIALTLTPDTIRAETEATSLAAATVVDANGNPVSGEQVSFDSTGTQQIAPTVDNGDGTYTATITGSTQPGTSTVTAYVRSLTAESTLTQTSTAPEPPEQIDPPTAEISSPTGTLVLAPGSVGPTTRFSCTEGEGGPGLTSCLDSNGAEAPTGTLDTSRTGRQTYRVTATSGSGQTGSARLSYLVAAPPTVTITTPTEGGRYTYGQSVATDVRCVDGEGGPGIRSCVETGHAPGAPGRLDTSTAGAHEYSVTATSDDGLSTTQTVRYTVTYPPLEAAIGAVDGVNVVKQPVPFSVSARGGLPPYRYTWSGPDADADGAFPTGSASKLAFAFGKAGQRSVRVQVTDSADPPQVVSDARTVTIEDKCVRTLELGVAKVTGACLKPTAESTDTRPVLRSTSGVKVNGLLVSSDAIDVHVGDVTTPSRFVAADATVSVRGTPVQTGRMDWTIPFVVPTTGKPAETPVTGASVPPSGSRMLGLALGAGGQWFIGRDADGSAYTRYLANLVIPDFTTNVVAVQGMRLLAVTAPVNVRIDSSGSTIKSAYAQVQNAKLGTNLSVANLCLSFAAAGVTDRDGLNPEGAQRCGTFTKPDGNSILSCRTNPQEDRWDGTAELKLPFKALKGIHASGSVSAGKLSYLAAAVDLGRSVPLTDGIAWLTQVRAGVCLRPPPLTITGGATIGALPDPKTPLKKELIHVNGDFLYTDGHTDDQGREVPWNARITGKVDAFGQDVGSGHLSVGGNNVASMRLETDQSYAGGMITLGGYVDGQMSFSTGRFNVEGGLHACLASVICANAQALVSSDGLSACVTVIPSIDFGLFSTPALRSGFGFRWSNQRVTIMIVGCDIGDWRTAVSRAAMRSVHQGGPRSPSAIQVSEGELLKTIRLVGGPGGAPNVTLHGPQGETLQIPAGQQAVGAFGKHMMIRDTASDDTLIQLAQPSEGTWTVTPNDTTSPVLRIDEAPVLARPKVTGTLTELPSGERRLSYTYTSQEGVKVGFDEVGADNASHRPLVVDAAPCAEKICSGSVDFAPALGHRGERNIVATVTRSGNLVDRPVVAKYVAPGTSAGPVGRPTVRRTHTNEVRVCWTAARDAVAYDVSARERFERSGKRVAFGYGVGKTVKRPCATFPSPSSGAQLHVTVAATDAIGGRGPSTSVRLNVPRPLVPARVRGVQVHRIARGRLFVSWRRPAKLTSKLAVVVRSARGQRQGTVSARCRGMVIVPPSRGRVTVTVAGLTRTGLPGGRTTQRVTPTPLGRSTTTPPVDRRSGCKWRR